jgi:hypothetical protein
VCVKSCRTRRSAALSRCTRRVSGCVCACVFVKDFEELKQQEPSLQAVSKQITLNGVAWKFPPRGQADRGVVFVRVWVDVGKVSEQGERKYKRWKQTIEQTNKQTNNRTIEQTNKLINKEHEKEREKDAQTIRCTVRQTPTLFVSFSLPLRCAGTPLSR